MAQLEPLILERQGRGAMAGLLSEGPEQRQPQQVRLGGYVLAATFERGAPAALADGVVASAAGAGPPPPSGGLVLATGTGEFILAGTAVTVTFASTERGRRAGILSAEEGRFVEGLAEHPLAQWRRDPPGAPRAAGAGALLHAAGEAVPLSRFRPMTLACLLPLVAAWAAAEPPLLHPLFADHAVLQRDRPIDVWGFGTPGAEVTVTLAAAQVSARTDASGRWSVRLPALPAGGPHHLTARAASGTVQTVGDVLIGDVWLCSGQSNMVLQVSRSLSPAVEIAGSANHRIRMVTIPQVSSATPLDTFASALEWKRADPAHTGNFSAACYYFARELQKTVDVPMGLVVAAWGGSKIQPWMSAQALRSLGGNDRLLAMLDEHPRDPASAASRFGALWQDWWKSVVRDPVRGDPWNPRHDPSWRQAPAALGYWETWGVPELADYNGIVLYRTRVQLTAEQARQPAVLSIGPVDEIDVTWVNGRGVGSSSGGDRSYRLAPGVLQAGDNVIVVSALDTYLRGGLPGPLEKLALVLDEATRLPLDTWWYQVAPGGIGPPPRAPWESTAGLGTIYNAMIAPLGHFGFRGALWCQGESNANLPEAEAYESQLTALMADWRRRFGSELPFFVAQLANYGTVPTSPVESGWAQVREGQRRAVAADAHAGLAVAIDIGEPYELHPANKQELGRRLARAARRVAYGERLAMGPQPVAATREGARITVSFRDVDGHLVARSGRGPTAFELCGPAPGSCRYVDAALRGPAVSLDASEVAGATRVRYGWADAPICTLADRSGLPAPPFELEIR